MQNETQRKRKQTVIQRLRFFKCQHSRCNDKTLKLYLKYLTPIERPSDRRLSAKFVPTIVRLLTQAMEFLPWSSGQSSCLQNKNILCFLWGTNWIYICYVEESRPPLWSSGQSSWQQIRRPGFNSRRYRIFWQTVGLERSPLSLVSTTEELLDRKCSGSGLESREYGHRDSSCWPRDTFYPQKFALTSPTIGGRSVSIGQSRNQATEFSF
jgi:hypothetical protein